MGTFPHETPADLRSFAAAWLKGYSGRTGHGARPRTVVEYERDLDLHVIPFLGTRPIAEIRPAEIKQLAKMLATGVGPSARGHSRRPLAPGSVRNVFAALRAMLNDAVAEGDIAVNPCNAIRLPGTRAGDRGIVVLTPAELDRLIEAAPEGMERTLLRLLAQTGVRISEAMGLRWADTSSCPPVGRRYG